MKYKFSTSNFENPENHDEVLFEDNKNKVWEDNIQKQNMNVKYYDEKDFPELTHSISSKKEYLYNNSPPKFRQNSSPAFHIQRKKTKFCNNYSNCSYGTRCKYAHTLDELSPIPCLFGNKCTHFASYMNTCKFIHPCENKQQYISRTNINKFRKCKTSCVPKFNEGLFIYAENDLNNLQIYIETPSEIIVPVLKMAIRYKQQNVRLKIKACPMK